MQKKPYPALIVERLTPVYDLFAKIFIPERRFKRDLISQARIAPGQHVLDLGAGTGTLAIMVKTTHPEARVTGLDSDPEILSIARLKASRSGQEITFETSSASALPFSGQTFDKILSTLVMSLLVREEKLLAIREAYRVLKSAGEFHIADFGPPHTRWGRLIAPRMRQFEPIIDNLDGLLPAFLEEAGFERVQTGSRYSTLLGTISTLSGRKPA